MLEVKNISKAFGKIKAVNDVSFTVRKGEVLGLLGPNGAGKSTTARIITGFIPPDNGTVKVNDYDITENSIKAKKQIGYLPEDAPLYSDMTVWNYLHFIAEIRGFSGKSRKERVIEAIKKCKLEQVTYRPIETLSKGFNQRVCMAQSILHNPPVLILDEPTAGLDPNQKFVVREMIKQMAPEKIIILSTHILEEVDAVCSRAIILGNGSIVANGTPEELRQISNIHNAIELNANGNSSEIITNLRILKAVSEVKQNNSTYIIYPEKGNEIFNDVFNLVKEHPEWQVSGLNTVAGRLDEVFRKLTTKQ
jgi:ABC-2 type transport system ATP-binding protein